jgi:DNA-binding response OmpR family regulator
MTTASRRLLVVDDDPKLRDLLQRYLASHQFAVTLASDAGSMDRLIRRQVFDLIILDLMLPGEDGLSIVRRLRAGGHVTPVIMLTAKGDDVDRIVGLEMGADDYLGKPFNPRELAARLRAIQRRVTGLRGGREVLEVGDVVLDVGARTVRRAGREVPLTSAEFALLELLLRAAGRVISRDTIAESVLGRRLSAFDRSVDVHVSNLRKKLESTGAERIKTVRGAGYVFTMPEGDRGA